MSAEVAPRRREGGRRGLHSLDVGLREALLLLRGDETALGGLGVGHGAHVLWEEEAEMSEEVEPVLKGSGPSERKRRRAKRNLPGEASMTGRLEAALFPEEKSSHPAPARR